MGEAFKRMRAQEFKHQNHEPYQKMVDHDLLSAARQTQLRRELTCRLAKSDAEVVEGSTCVVRASGDGFEVLHGNNVVAKLGTEARDSVAAYQKATPSLNGLLPCRVTRVGVLGAVTLEVLGPETDD